MRAGTMRDRVTFQRPVKVNDGAWGTRTQWQDFLTVWAEVAGVGGTEGVKDQGVQATTRYTIKLRHTDAITTENRATFRGHTLDIVSAVDPTGRRCELLVTAAHHVEAAANG